MLENKYTHRKKLRYLRHLLNQHLNDVVSSLDLYSQRRLLFPDGRLPIFGSDIRAYRYAQIMQHNLLEYCKAFRLIAPQSHLDPTLRALLTLGGDDAEAFK